MLKKNKLKLATAGAALAIPFLPLPASAASCTIGETGSFTCSESDVTYMGLSFTNITVTSLVAGGGSMVLGALTEVTPAPGEFGLALTYTANTGTNPNGVADISLVYNVAGSSIDDAYAQFTGNTSGTGTAVLAETLSNGVTLSLSAPGMTLATFPATSSLFVTKDQNDFANTEGSATTSVLVNAFSLTSTPIPGSLPLMATGLAGLWGLRKKRKAKKAAAAT